MKSSLLFSSYPFITGEKVTLTRVTDMDNESLWQIFSVEDSHRFTRKGPCVPQGVRRQAPPV